MPRLTPTPSPRHPIDPVADSGRARCGPFLSPNRPWSPLRAIPILLGLAVSAAPAEAYRAPFVIKEGAVFEAGGGRPFLPRGFNYTRLAPWHVTVNPGYYDSAAAEALFARLAGAGYNVVRFWVGLEAGAKDAGPYSDAMLANIADFLRRGRRHGVYGLPTFEYLPQAHRYAALAAPDPEGVEGVNSLYLNAGSIRIYRRFLADFLIALRARDPGILEAIFAIDAQNECHFELAGALARDSGSFTAPNGKTYRLPAERRSLAEESAAFWVDALAEAIRSVAPGMPLDVSVFTFAAVGRAGAGDFRASLPDARMPFNPAALAGSQASLLDVHVYAPDSAGLATDFASIGLDGLRAQATRSGKALIMGEFGSFKQAFPALESAVAWQAALIRASHAAGFRGFLGWTYDTWEQPDIWNARDGEGALFDALAIEFGRLEATSGARTVRAPRLVPSPSSRGFLGSRNLQGRKLPAKARPRLR